MSLWLAGNGTEAFSKLAVVADPRAGEREHSKDVTKEGTERKMSL